MPEKEYIRLARGRRSNSAGFSTSGGYASLWQGNDHLLSIDSSGYTEEYKRFYYRDIQAIIIQRTGRRLFSSLLLMLPLGICGLVVLSAGDPVVAWCFGILSIPLLVMLIYNLACGPTTRCFLRTAVQTEELPALNRLRRVRKVLARIETLVAEAQGAFTPGELSARLQEFFSDQPAAAAPTAADAPPAAEIPPVINA